MTKQRLSRTLTRRQFLATTTAGFGIGLHGVLPARHASAADGTGDEPVSFGLVTDVHYADAARKGSRWYRDSQEKLRLAVETFQRNKLPLIVELGDFIDAGPGKAAEIKYLHAIREVFGEFSGERHYVLGNHCVGKLTKGEFLANCGSHVEKSYYSFDRGRYHFIVLDADFKRNGSPYAAGNFQWTDTWIHEAQQKWLADDLQKAGDKKSLVFVHQNLDRENDAHGVKNAPQVRDVLQQSGSVLAVFQGHKHSGGYQKIGGIHYCTLRAMVEGPGPENNAYAMVTLDRSDRITLQGFGRQKAVAFD